MSLAQQLSHLKQQRIAHTVSPHQQQPTLILSNRTANTTTQDLLYTLAIISYYKLLREKPSLRTQGEIVMAEQNREMNRNTLLKEANRELSEKLIKFLLKISPYFMTEDCQRIIEYLLNNYKVNVFQGQALAIIYLQYWNSEIYQKLISNIPARIISSKLPFLNKNNEKDVFNISYVIKNLAYNHHLMSTLALYTLEYIKSDQLKNMTMDIEININDSDPSLQPIENLMRCDPRKFLSIVFNCFLDRKMTNCYKYILEFCSKCVGLKSVTGETSSMVMVLATRLLIEQSISEQLLSNFMLRLIKKSFNLPEQQLQSLHNFVLICWQRKPNTITPHLLEHLTPSHPFQLYLKQFKHSLWMVLIRFIQLLTDGTPCQELINIIGKRIKKDEFYLAHQQNCHQQLFSLLNSQNQHLQTLSLFYQKYYLHELASYYHLKILPLQLRQLVVSLFDKKHYQIKDDRILFKLKLIPKQVIARKSPEYKEEQKQVQSEQEQQEKLESINQKTNISLLNLLREKGLKGDRIAFEEEAVKSELALMVGEYYNDKLQLDVKDKNNILQHYPEMYIQEYFEKDLLKCDFLYPIKFLYSSRSLTASKQALLFLTHHFPLLDNILYKELFRIALSLITQHARTNHKTTIHFLNTLFKKHIQQPTIERPKLSQHLLKISEQVLRENLRKGKYHKLLHNHGRLLGQMVMGLKNKQKVGKIKIDEVMILHHYTRIIQIFTEDNLYLLNIGILELLTKQTQHNHLPFFIKNVILQAINQRHIDYYSLIKSLVKTIVFTKQLDSIITFDDSCLPAEFKAGIAKNSVIDFFGIVKGKFKKVLIKKVFLLVKNLFENSYMIERFKAHLNDLKQAQLQKLLTLFTEFYRLLGVIESKDENIIKIKDDIRDKITNMFPLELRITIFEPLLPNQPLYCYLAQQLAQHALANSSFTELQPLVNIVPLEVSFQWVQFMKQCLKRGNEPGQKLMQSIIGSEKAMGSSSNVAQFICEVSQYYPQSLHPHLEQAISIIQHHLQQPNDFTLAIVARLIINLGQILHPYLSNLITICLNTQSPLIQGFIDQITQNLSQPTLIALIKQNYKTITNIHNFSLLFRATVAKGVGDSLSKTLLNFMKRSLFSCLQSEESPESIIQLQSEIYVEIGVKMTQNELRKSIIELVRWCEAKSQRTQQFAFNPKKIILVCIFGLFSHKLEELFNNFYGYVLESLLKDYQNISLRQSQRAKQQKGAKRLRQQNDEYSVGLNVLMLNISLNALTNLFQNDAEHEFIDSIKAEQISQPLVQLLLLASRHQYSSLVQQTLIPTIQAFYHSIADDYQMKNVNLKVLLLLRSKKSGLVLSVFTLIDALIESLKDRFLLLTSDVVPFLMQYAGNRQQAISKMVRKIIIKIEQLSGEQIHTYTK